MQLRIVSRCFRSRESASTLLEHRPAKLSYSVALLFHSVPFGRNQDAPTSMYVVNTHRYSCFEVAVYREKGPSARVQKCCTIAGVVGSQFRYFFPQRGNSPVDRSWQGIFFAGRGTEQTSPLSRHRATYRQNTVDVWACVPVLFACIHKRISCTLLILPSPLLVVKFDDTRRVPHATLLLFQA